MGRSAKASGAGRLSSRFAIHTTALSQSWSTTSPHTTQGKEAAGENTTNKIHNKVDY